MRIVRAPRGTKRNLSGFLLSLLGIGVATAALKLLGFEEHIYNVTLVYIIIVLLIASRYGLWPGLLSSLLGFFCLNFFFIPPYYTLLIDSWSGVVAVIGFLVAAIITSQIAAHARLKTEEAQLRHEETAALNRLNMAALSTAQAAPMLQQLVQEVALHLEATASQLYLPPTQPGQVAEARASYFKEPQPETFFQPETVQQVLQSKEIAYKRVPEYGRMAYLPLLGGGEVLGVLAVLVKASHPAGEGGNAPIFDAEEQRWLRIVANQAALTVDHAHLIEETAQVNSLKEADRFKSTLLASVSHELRTPLTSIKTAVAGLKDDSIKLEPEEQREYLEAIDQEADRLDHLISNLLDLSRIETGTLQPQKGLYNLPEIIGQTIERLARAPILATHPIYTRFQEGLPLVPVDYVQLEQVISNLVENAAKYSPPGRPVTIRVAQANRPVSVKTRHSASREDHPRQAGALVEVLDEGVGVPEAELEHIFDKFYRAGQKTKSGLNYSIPGSGLGLAICKGIIEAHGGLIWAKPRPYGGSVFAFWLPAAPLPEAALSPEDNNSSSDIVLHIAE